MKTSTLDNKACKGENISINCSADALPSVTSYQLLENDIVILDTSGRWNKILTTAAVFNYKCVANNNIGTRESENVIVTVNGKQSSFLTTESCVELFSVKG